MNTPRKMHLHLGRREMVGIILGLGLIGPFSCRPVIGAAADPLPPALSELREGGRTAVREWLAQRRAADGLTRDVERITVRGCVFITRTSAMKLGTESNAEYHRDILFEDNDVVDVVDADRAINLSCNDGAL